MTRITRSRPSPAIIVAVVALIAALAGTAMAGPDASTSVLNRAKVKNIARKQANKAVQTVFPITGADLGVVTTRTVTQNVNSGQAATATANCQPGERVLSGGFVYSAPNGVFAEQDRKQGEGWLVQVFNFSGANQTFTVEANCLAP
jgi:hypothetical protein